MALSLDFDVYPSCDNTKLIFKETTGSYNADTNSGGYESASTTNPATSDATAASLVVTDPGGTEYTLNLLSLASFPVSDRSTYDITMDLLGGGLGDVIPDGLYRFKYTVTTDSGDPAGASNYTKSKDEIFYGVIQCCVFKQLADLDLECSDCDRKKKEDALMAFTLLQNLKYSAACGTVENFDVLLASINKLCNMKKCVGCGSTTNK